MIYEMRGIAAEGEAIDLDPFAFWPEVASRLQGLGGDEPSDNPDYAFHTLYASCGTGPILFTLRFVGLQAQRGTLILRVHELPEVMGAHARQIAISQTQLADLIRHDGVVSLSAMARAKHHYAILGYIYGDTVATAENVRIEVARRNIDADDPTQPTNFHADECRIARVQQIVVSQEGTLAAPVSQLCTRRQIREPIFETILAQLSDMSEQSLIDRWEHAFLARVLDRYDVARSGARGLGIGALDDPLVPWLATHGCSLLLTTPHQVQKDITLPPQVEVRRMDASRMDELAGFDFAWATRSGAPEANDRQEVLRFIEETLRALKPGGLMTLVVPVDVSPRPIGNDAGPFMRRHDIDRTVLLLLSRGHQVAQLCPWGDAILQADVDREKKISAFGLVIRKAS